jgi:hypothetical protein
MAFFVYNLVTKNNGKFIFKYYKTSTLVLCFGTNVKINNIKAKILVKITQCFVLT